MRKPLLGFLFALACAAAGFLWGRHRRAESERREAAARAVPVPPPVAVSTAALEVPPDLPTEPRAGDSVPRGLE